MTVEKIQVYDPLGTKKVLVIRVNEDMMVSTVCKKVDPHFKQNDKTLYIGDLELLWNWNIRYLIKHHSLKNQQRLTLLVRFYDFEQTCKNLQLEENEVRTLVNEKKIKAFSKAGKIIFRKKDVDELRDSMMECPTLMITNTKDLEARLKGVVESQAEDYTSTAQIATQNKLKIFDSTTGKSTILDFDPEKSVYEFCEEVNPKSEQEGMTLFQNKKELDRYRILSDLIANNEVDIEQKFVLKIRFYTKEETMEKLGISETELRRRVQLKELKVFSKKGKWVFKKKAIDELAVST